MPSLPVHLEYGRTDYPGPITGNYLTITFGGYTLPAPAVTDLIIGGLVMPFAFRILRASWAAIASPTAATSFTLHRNSTFAVGGNDILSADVNIITGQQPSGVADPSGTTTTLAVRDLNRGDCVFTAITTDATGSIPFPFIVSLHGFVTGVVNLHEGDD